MHARLCARCLTPSPVMGPAASCRTGKRKRRNPSLPRGPAESRLDINQATEEELMTLPGISRALAQSITVHRRKIRGFRKVEDLALVTGVGAEHMLQLRPEITVGSVAQQLAASNGTLKTEEENAKADGNEEQQPGIT